MIAPIPVALFCHAPYLRELRFSLLCTYRVGITLCSRKFKKFVFSRARNVEFLEYGSFLTTSNYFALFFLLLTQKIFPLKPIHVQAMFYKKLLSSRCWRRAASRWTQQTTPTCWWQCSLITGGCYTLHIYDRAYIHTTLKHTENTLLKL